MKNEKDNQNLHVPYASRHDMILYAALGVLGIGLVAVLCKFVTVIEPVFIALIVLLVNSTYGRAFKAIRDDEIAAEAMGINLAKHKRMAFIISSFL